MHHVKKLDGELGLIPLKPADEMPPEISEIGTWYAVSGADLRLLGLSFLDAVLADLPDTAGDGPQDLLDGNSLGHAD